MEKIYYLFIIAILATACKVNEPTEPFKLDPLATVNIKPEKGAWKSPAMRAKAENPLHLSALDIVKQTTVMQYYNPNIGVGSGKIERMFDKLQRDTISETPSLKMWATDIINDKGEYVPEFIEAHDIILIHFHEMTPTTARDTIGYIPNSVIRAAQSAVKTAYDDNDPEEVLRLFNEVFIFRPVTGAEYKALKASGNQ